MKALKIAAVLLLAVGMFSSTAMAQDDCATAIPAPGPVTPCTDSNPTGPLGGCTSGGGLFDAWVTFVATSTAHRVRTDVASTGTDSDYRVYSGTCGSLVQVAGGCSEDEVGYLGDICVTGLNPGDTYYIQVGAWGDGAFGSCGGDYALTIQTAGEICGDGILSCTGSEECDDGNTTPGDGCDAVCIIEPICGNSVVEPGEECDDGNILNGDGCSSTCQNQGICGNGLLEIPDEQCDDSNNVAGDGCDSACQWEGTPPVPAVSEWGLLVLVLVGLTVGTVLFGRRQQAVA